VPVGVEYDESLSSPHMLLCRYSRAHCWRRGSGTVNVNKGSCPMRKLGDSVPPCRDVWLGGGYGYRLGTILNDCS
jgi:hypothetical protein